MQRNALSRSSLRRSGTPASGGGGGGGDCCADWNLTIGRYFFVDPVNGNDSNEGWIDAALGSTFTPANVAVVAIRTHARLREVLPSSGNNRTAIVFYGAATYGEAMDWRGVSGYRQLLRRGSTDFTNSVSDRTTAGFVTALAGPNGDGSFTVAAASTVDLVNISVGAFTAEPGILGYRIRFTGNVTAALLNVSQPIYSNTGSSLVPESALSAVPAVGDTFFIERPGAVFNAYYPSANVSSRTDLLGTWPVVGIRIDSTVAASFVFGAGNGYRAERMAGIEQSGVSVDINGVNASTMGGLVSINSTYTDEADVLRNVGMCIRNTDRLRFDNSLSVTISSLYDMSARTDAGSIYSGIRCAMASTSGYIATGASLQQVFGSVDMTNTGGRGRSIGPLNASTTRPLRIPAKRAAASSSLSIFCGGNWIIRNTVITNAGAFPAIKVEAGRSTLILTNVTGATGNTDVGLDVVAGQQCVVDYVSGNTLTGTAGDIRLVGPAITSIAGLALTNVVDSQRNNIQGAAGQVVDVCKLVTNDNGSALAVGQVVQGNGTTNEVQSAIASSSAVAHVSGVMVTPPANGAAGYMVCAGSPYVLFDAAPTPGAIAYLDDATTGTLTTTAPADALLVGRVISASGSTGRVAWHPQNAIQSSSGASEDDIVLHEPFILTKATDNPLSLEIVSTAGGGMDQEIGVAAHQGVASLYSVLAGFTLLRSGNGEVSFLVPPVATGIWTYDWIFNLDQLSTATDRFVLHVGSSDDSVTFDDAVECKYSDNINGGNFQLRTAAAGTPTVVDSGVTVAAATWYYMRLEVTQEEVRLYVDTVRGTRTLRATSNTNIPTVGQMHMFNVETTALVLASIRQDVDDFKATFHFN